MLASNLARKNRDNANRAMGRVLRHMPADYFPELLAQPFF
jgi:hypothetical protein